MTGCHVRPLQTASCTERSLTGKTVNYEQGRWRKKHMQTVQLVKEFVQNHGGIIVHTQSGHTEPRGNTEPADTTTPPARSV